MSRRSICIRGIRVLLLSIAAVTGLVGCREGAAGLGGSAAEARANADGLFRALAARFGPAETAAGYDEFRGKVGRYALSPSRLLNDSALWSAAEGDTRWVGFGGRPGPATYVLGERTAAVAPARPGDYLRSVELRALGGDQYEWSVRDELVAGSASGDDLGAALSALLRSAERSDPASLRGSHWTALPGTTQALGRLFTLDSIAVTPAPAGGRLISIATTTHPDRIESEFPDLARFLDRYGSPAIVELVIEDLAGTRWWTASLERDRMHLRLRVADGRLAPLDGVPRAMPERLVARIAASTRFGLFRVGLSDLVADVTLTREPDVKAFTARFRDEPEWNFPPLVERLIRAPLRRPFDGEGASLTYAVRTAGGRTSLVRDYRIAVHESAILRWIGSLGSAAVSDFRRGAEREADLFNGAALSALRADVQALLR